MIILIFIFGLMVGSFINCVIYRLHTNQSFIKGRSFCPHCKHSLGFFDLIPIFSFIFLKGKCRYCGKKISWEYPLVEFITGIVFIFVYLETKVSIPMLAGGETMVSIPMLVGWGTKFYIPLADGSTMFMGLEALASSYLIFLRNLFFAAVLIIVFIYDFKYQLISDHIIIPAVIISFLLNIMLKIGWLDLLLGAIIGSSFFLFQYLISKGKWIGAGDIYLGFLMGVILGWKKVIIAIVLSYFIGSVIAIVLVALKKEKWKSKIALGPFLTIGALIALLYGEKILEWYLGY